MQCLERLCALHSNDKKLNVNFRLNLDEMCSVLTLGLFHSVHASHFIGTLNLFLFSLSLSPSPSIEELNRSTISLSSTR